MTTYKTLFWGTLIVLTTNAATYYLTKKRMLVERKTEIDAFGKLMNLQFDMLELGNNSKGGVKFDGSLNDEDKKKEIINAGFNNS